MQINDEALVAQAKADPQVFGALYDRYVDRIYGYALQRTQDETTAQDITAVNPTRTTPIQTSIASKVANSI